VGYGWHLLRSAQFISQSRNVTLLRYEADARNEPRHAYCHCYKRIRPCKIKLRRGEQTRICVRSVPTSTHNQRERVPCHVDRNSVSSDMKYVLQLRLGQDVGTLANRKWVVTAFIKIKAKLKDNPWNKRQTTYVTTRDLHTQHLRGRRYWEAISGCSSTYFIPRISARVVCVCVWGGGAGEWEGVREASSSSAIRACPELFNRNCATKQIFAKDRKSSKLHSRRRQEKNRIYQCLIALTLEHCSSWLLSKKQNVRKLHKIIYFLQWSIRW
jgi:hypothetical protein